MAKRVIIQDVHNPQNLSLAIQKRVNAKSEMSVSEISHFCINEQDRAYVYKILIASPSITRIYRLQLDDLLGSYRSSSNPVWWTKANAAKVMNGHLSGKDNHWGSSESVTADSSVSDPTEKIDRSDSKSNLSVNTMELNDYQIPSLSEDDTQGGTEYATSETDTCETVSCYSVDDRDEEATNSSELEHDQSWETSDSYSESLHADFNDNMDNNVDETTCMAESESDGDSDASTDNSSGY